MSIAYVALGSNLGDKSANMRWAVRRLTHGGCRVLAASSLYATRPVGVEDQPDFLNAVISVETTLAPHQLLDLCHGIEKSMGRTRTIRWGPRVIDIDILLYDDVELADADLTLPHPRMLERAFVLVPLAEIAPDLVLAGGVIASEAARSVIRDGVERIDSESWTK